MKETKFSHYDIDKGFWAIDKLNRTRYIGKSIAIFYDHKVGIVKYHGNIRKVKAKINELTESQKQAENELGFFLTEYRYYEFKDIEATVLNRIVNEEGFFPENLKQL